MSYKLKDIVSEYLIEIGEGQNNKFARFYQYGLSFLRKTNFNTTGFPKVVELTINSNDTADLPADYVSYTRIALSSGGRLYSLGRDESISVGVDEEGDSASPGYVGSPLIADNYVNGEMVGRLFGVGGDNNCYGYYRIDKTNNQIQFRDLLQTSDVILEYLADVSVSDGDFDVHPFMIEALKDWMQWKYKQRSSRPLGEQQVAEQNFNNSNRLMRMMFNSSTKEEWVAAFASGNLAAPKM